MLRYPTEVSGFGGGEKVEYYLMPADKNGIRIPLKHDGSATPMAGAVRHCTYRTLQLKKGRHKRFAYQFWLCDAQPNSSGEGIDAVVDTAKAVQEAKARGIRQFGIIIAGEKEKEQMEEAYRKIFGGGWYVVVTTAEAMMNPLLKFMQRVAIVNR
jgi:nitric oxide reductase activation protein